MVRFFIEGFFDANLNTIKDPGEEVSDYLNPDGSRKIDWMGVQHYFRMFIRPETTLGLPLDLLLQRPLDCLFLVLPQPHGHFIGAAIRPGVVWDGREGLWAKREARAVGAALDPRACL